MFNPDSKPPAELIPMSTANINTNCAEALDGERARVNFCSSGLKGPVQSVTPESIRHKGKAKTPGCSGLHFLSFNCATSHCREMEVSEDREADLDLELDLDPSPKLLCGKDEFPVSPWPSTS